VTTQEKPYESPLADATGAGTAAADTAAPGEVDRGNRMQAAVWRDRALWGMTATQFLGAFNDNVYKQLVLLLAISVPATAAATDSAGGEAQDLQGIGLGIFSLPFILFSGIAGYFSERHGKRSVIVLAKLAEIGIMLAGVAAFALYGQFGIAGLFVVLFLMGAQSAFFGPGKYGILPELFRKRDLPQANGVILMTTFLAIIFGAALAGELAERFQGRLWIASAVCVAIAVVGTLTSLIVRRVPAAKPDLKITPAAFVVPGDVWRRMRQDPPLIGALLASCMFWLVGGIVHASVNSLGKVQLLVGDRMTSLLAASVGVGIAVGCVLAGRLSRGKVNFAMMRIGACGIVVCLALVALLNPADSLLPESWRTVSEWGLRTRYAATMGVLVVAGAFTGLFAVPLQVFLQSRPPDDQKGRMIATMNLANWIAIILGAAIYAGFDLLLTAFEWPRSVMFVLTASLMLPVVVFYRPKTENLE
jgi:acyl-[acyl-carrier-protein]-phospholipid O-acyltransferase/long-chain-fatty-acid--[acyl-carrier-protein] ligase